MTRRIARTLSDDSGIAMLTVVGVSTIVFLLLTTLFVLTNYRTSQSSHGISRTQATQLADAGLNFYLYQLSTDYTYYLKTPTPVPTLTNAQGSWTASATYSAATKLVTIRSVGTLPNGTSRTVVAECSPPPPPMYAIGSGGDISVGADTLIKGPIRSNGSISITTGGSQGIIEGKALSGTKPSGSFSPKNGSGVPDPNRFKGGTEYKPAQDFASMNVDVAAMKVVAQSGGLYLPSSRSDGKTPNASGYIMEFAGNSISIKRLANNGENRAHSTPPTAAQCNVLGRLTPEALASTQSTVAIPANGVIFVDSDNVWVSGTYTARVTICAARASTSDTTYGNITVKNSVLCGDKSNSKTLCGLMAQNNVWLPDWYSETLMDATLNIEAALLAQYGRIGDRVNSSTGSPMHAGMPSNSYGNYPQHNLLLAGAANGNNGVGFATDYFIYRTYGFDKRLEVETPPYWPRTDKDFVMVSSWLEN